MLKCLKHIIKLEILVPISFLALAIFVSVGLLHNSYKTSLDLGIFTQMMRNFWNGDLLFYNSLEGYSHFAIHFSPILYLITPFYKVFPSPITLLVIQCVLVAIASYMVFVIAMKCKLSYRISLILEILFCLNPLVWGLLLFDFHEVVFALPLLFVMIYGLLGKKQLIFYIGLILSLLVKEDVTATILVLGLSLLVYNYVKFKKISSQAIAMVVSSIFIIIATIIISSYLANGDNSQFVSIFQKRYFSYSNGGIGNVLFRFIDIYSVMMVCAYFMPLIFLPFKKIEWVLPAMMILFVSMLSSAFGQHNQVTYYGVAAVPYLFIASILALKNYEIVWNNEEKRESVNLIFTIAIMVSIVITFLPMNKGNELFKRDVEHSNAVNEVLRRIPNDVSVSASTRILPHLASRNEVYLDGLPHEINDKVKWGFPDIETDYVIVDGEITDVDTWEDLKREQVKEKYKLIYSADGCELYKKVK